jgi:hypothetical protein
MVAQPIDVEVANATLLQQTGNPALGREFLSGSYSIPVP